MQIVSFLIALAALVIAVLAYVRTGGIQGLRNQLTSLGSATDAIRMRTAKALDGLERAMRGRGRRPRPSVPEESKED